MTSMSTTLESQKTGSSRDQREIDGFSAHALSWWDTEGPFAPLHRLNPTRIRIIADLLSEHFSRPLGGNAPFFDLNLTDVGCGGGLVAEPFARLGFDVTGMDASEENIATAKEHAASTDLQIDYRVGAPEDAAFDDQIFDAVIALEVVEHVSDIETFVNSLTTKVKPGGILVMSTINRTLKSMALAKIAAEYILRWVPAGTHTWSKFVKPSELSHHLRREGFRVNAMHGMDYDLSTGEWSSSEDVSVNYVLAATKA